MSMSDDLQNTVHESVTGGKRPDAGAARGSMAQRLAQMAAMRGGQQPAKPTAAKDGQEPQAKREPEFLTDWPAPRPDLVAGLRQMAAEKQAKQPGYRQTGPDTFKVRKPSEYDGMSM